MIQAERADPHYPEDEQILIQFVLPHTDMVERFGPAHRLKGPEDQEFGPCEYWAFRFPCGLITFITYFFDAPIGPGGTVFASAPEIAHILKHLPIADCVTWRLDEAGPEFYKERYGDRDPSVSCPSNGHV